MFSKALKAGFAAIGFMVSGVCAQDTVVLPDNPPIIAKESALDAEAVKFIGNWIKPPCGSRRYPRTLIVNADGTFSATDWARSGNAQDSTDTQPATIEHEGTWRLLNPGMIGLTSTTPSSRGVERMPAAIGFDSGTGTLHEATPGSSILCKYNRTESGQSPDTAGTGLASVCHDAVQGRIAWDYQGNKSWREDNVTRLCAGADESIEPARCFETAMHGAVDRGDNSQWQWSHAVDLCSGTSDADATLRCFADRISEGTAWSDSVKDCNAGTRADE
jgi:hypothetical protein